MKYKVGNEIKIRSDLRVRDTGVQSMLEYRGKKATIKSGYVNGAGEEVYRLDTDDGFFFGWKAEMFEGLVEAAPIYASDIGGSSQ